MNVLEKVSGICSSLIKLPVRTGLGVLLFCILSVVLSPHFVVAKPLSKPNVIVIITDDQGYGDMSCHGNPYLKTPNLDKLHTQSIRLADFHVDPMCAPTRAALMTGRYSARAGVWSTLNGCYIPPRDEVTMGHLFSNGGYKTAMFGKWHLGDEYPYGAEHRGFQHVVRHAAGVIGEVPDRWNNDYFDDMYLKNGTWQKFNGYCTDVWFSETMQFIKSNKEEPFFCYLAPNAVHSPFNIAEKYVEPYKHLSIPDKRKRFYGMIANFDENIGQLMAFLDEEKLADNTVLIFMGDNGTSMGCDYGFRTNRKNKNNGFNAGMRGRKTEVYDGGHRNACFIRYPRGGITGGRDVSGLSAHIDLMPTLAELCGLKLPNKKLDGMSLVPQLKGDVKACPDRSLVVHNMQRVIPHKYKDFTVMTNRWRLVKRGLKENGKTELFDISKDPGQNNNLATKFPEVVKSMKVTYESWWESISPSFKHISYNVVGSDQQKTVTLTCHSWRTQDKKWSYSQQHVRKGVLINDAYWPLEVERDGDYRTELRRWPREADTPISSSLPAINQGPYMDILVEGKAFAVSKARLTVQGLDKTISVSKNDKAAVFDVSLKKGKTNLQTWFTYGGDKTVGSYYVYIERI